MEEKKLNDRYIGFGVGLALGLFIGTILGIMVLVAAVTENIEPLIEKIEINTINLNLNETRMVEEVHKIIIEEQKQEID